MLQPLQASLDHYEQLKLMEDMLKEEPQPRKVCEGKKNINLVLEEEARPISNTDGLIIVAAMFISCCVGWTGSTCRHLVGQY